MALSIKPGDLIRLNQYAQPWTEERVFVVDEVHSWGVVCYALAGDGKTYYQAVWDEIWDPQRRAAG